MSNYIFDNAREDVCGDCKIGKERNCGAYDCYYKYREFCPISDRLERIEYNCDRLLEIINATAEYSRLLKPKDADDLREEILFENQRGYPEFDTRNYSLTGITLADL